MTFDIEGHFCPSCSRIWAPDSCITHHTKCNGKDALCPNCVPNWRGLWTWRYKEDPFITWVKEQNGITV